MEMTMYLDDDLSRIDDLSVENIQKCLRSRYERDLIYTNISDILIAVNPCKDVPIYNSATHDEYRPDAYDTNQRPHIFQVATAAYKRMWEQDTNQVIIVSGESGAGKTESTKYMVKHIVHLCNQGHTDLHNKIVQINPLLEAFGNAKTTMNANSSRYAKYLEISFKENQDLAGVVVRDYMLEKSRVVHQSDGEGTFHFFYALFAGCPKNMLNDLFLEEPAHQYRIMQSDDESLAQTDKYTQMYNDSMNILKQLDVDREILHAMMAAVILIADIDFYEDQRGAAQITDESVAPFEHAAMLLNLNDIEFGEALIASTKVVRGDTIATQKTVSQAKDGRDALAKMLYERMFGWLVRSINTDLHPNRQGSNIHASIGILDIAGFEKLRTNSFEQLCINVVNEKLQNFMNLKIFKLEMDIYQREGIQLDGVEFKNNDDLLEMFDRPKVGVWAILDENARLAHGSDEGFVDRLKNQYADSPLFESTKSNRPEFFIIHFAANVLYKAEGFVEKNRDRLNEELVNVMRKSSNDFINDLFTVRRGPTGTISMETQYHIRKSRRGVPVMKGGDIHLKPTPDGAKLAAQLGKSINHKFNIVLKPSEKPMAAASQQTLVSCFKASLGQLLEKLGDGNPFFVRCIKANTSLQPNWFEDTVVQDQLKYNGLAEIAKIRKMGFDVRTEIKDFFKRYAFLFKLDKHSDATIVKRIPPSFHKDFRVGKTKIFMTSELHNWFEKALSCHQKVVARAARKVCECVRKVGAIKRRQREEAERRRQEELRKAEEERRRQEESRNSMKGTKISSTLRETGKGNPLRATGFGASIRASRIEPSPTPSTSTDTGSLSSSQGSEPHFHPPGNTAKPPSPVTVIDPSRSETGEDRSESKPEKEKERNKKEFWDVCQVIARERKIRDVDEDRGLQVIKVATYILFFCILFFCAVAQKISLMYLVSVPFDRKSNREENKRDDDAKLAAARHVLVTIAILIPYLLIFLSSVFKWMFGNFQRPHLSTLIWCSLAETLHSLGLCILCFVVLPDVDKIRGIFLLNGVAILPSVVFPVCASNVKQHSSEKKIDRSPSHRLVVYGLDILALLVQFGYIPVALLTDHFFDVSRVDKDTTYLVFFVISMIFISFSWWENFIDDRFCGKTRPRSFWKQAVLKTKYDLQESRPVVSTFTSFIKIGITFLMSYLMKEFLHINVNDNEKYIQEISLSEAFDTLATDNIKENTSIIVLTLCAFVGHYIGYTACKLKLQKFSFNIPLLLSTPVAIAILIADCSGANFLTAITDEFSECYEEGDPSAVWIHYLYGLIVLVSIYWICRHIFYPNIERLARTERLFVNPYYCGILFEQHLILNRRRHTRKVYADVVSDNKKTDGDINNPGDEDEFFKVKTIYRLSEYNSKVTIEGEEEDDKSEKGDAEKDDVQADDYINPKFRQIPFIYACATMWHETKIEMVQLMKSLYRMDRDQCLRKNAEIISGKLDKDFYDFEAHILFDDAMVLNDKDEMIPNDFVMTLMKIMTEAASSVYGKLVEQKDPYKVPTPYGGQLIFTLPGENFLFIHMKDKTKIRHRKRWSQVMYMYYLLGFRIVRMCQNTVTKALNDGMINALSGWEEEGGGPVGKSQIFRAFDDNVTQTASNTFLLALDGDVDFSPGAVRLLLDRMRKSEKVGAACGRIHPIGTGPVVWFQKFEYAIAHWLQKATEHVLGCVLCSPGCFSMFRGSALMDDNVMKKYTILPTEAAHHLMYDQGEDRWLCTLLLQQGYRVDYAAGSDAFTYAPEGFAEFFNQRRRWMPSTVFNIIDLLADYKNTVYANSNISLLYILYQGALLASTVVGPATVLMMIAQANTVVFKVSIIWGYIISLSPAIFYFIVCFYVKSKVQIQIAEVLTAFYAFVMMIVLVGTIITAAQESPFHPSVVFLAFLVLAFLFSAMLHPKEWSCIIFGALYFLLIPTGFLLLNIYSLCNLHVVSWGTREVAKKKTKEEEEEAKRLEEEKKKKKEAGFFGRMFPSFQAKELKETFSKLIESQGQRSNMDSETNKLLKEMNDSLRKLVEKKDTPPQAHASAEEGGQSRTDAILPTQHDEGKRRGILKTTHTDEHKHVAIADRVKVIDEDKDEVIYDKVQRERDDLVNPAWAECEELGKGKIIKMADEEMNFWKGFLKKYLEPLQMSEEKKKADAKGLIELRNNIALGMAMINLLWIAVNFMFQFESPTSFELPLTNKEDNPDTPEYLEENQAKKKNETADNILEVDALGLMFIFFYLAILILQFVGMLLHRWGTLLHLVSVTKLKNPLEKMSRHKRRDTKKEQGISVKEAKQIAEDMIMEPDPDYSTEESDDDSEETEHKLAMLQKTGARNPIEVNGTNIGATSRSIRQSIGGAGLRMTSNQLRATKILRNTVLAASRRNTFSPDGENLRDAFLRRNKYNNRPLPPVVQRKGRINFGPGRTDLMDRLGEIPSMGIETHTSNDRRPRVAEEEEDPIYDAIGKKGTLGRQLGKKLKRYAQTEKQMNHVSFANDGRPASTLY